MSTSSSSALVRDERGIAAVEFAIIVLPLVFLLFGIIQFGLVFAVQSAMERAVEAGARSAGIAAQQDSDPTEKAVQSIEGSLAPWWNVFFTEDAVDVEEPDCSSDTPGWTATVTIPMSTVAFVDPFGIIGSESDLTASATWPVGAATCSSSP